MAKTASIQFVVFGSAFYQKTVQLRDKVLRKPLGLKFTNEQLAAEYTDKHLAYMIGEGVFGCLILTKLTPEIVKMRQVAVDDDQQGKGIGAALVAYSEQWAKNNGYSTIMCHARDTAVSFYQKQGWGKIG